MPVVAIGDGAAQGRKDEHRNPVGEPNDAQQQWGTGETIHQPALRHSLHPGSDQGDDLTAGEQPVVPVPKRTEHPRPLAHLVAPATLASPGAASGYALAVETSDARAASARRRGRYRRRA